MLPIISISSVSERDVDLLLLEEFLSSARFSQWFLQKVLGEALADWLCVKAARSVTNSIGESDLEVAFKGPDGLTHLLLIENKVVRCNRFLDRVLVSLESRIWPQIGPGTGR